MNRAFAGIKVRQRQFGVDNVDIFRRVHFPRDVNNIIVFKTANHMADGFGFTDVGQKLVAKTFTFGRAFHQARDIHELHGGRQDALRFDDFSQLVQTRIGHRYDTGVRLNGTEGEVGRFNTRFGERIEQGGFADVGQTDDTAFESHDLNHLNLWIINLLQGTDCRKLNSFAYYTRCAAKCRTTTAYCALKACKRLVALVSPSFNQISVQRAASSTASSISFCSLAGGLPSTKPTTLFLSPGWPIPTRKR